MAKVPAQITSLKQIFELFNIEFTWGVSPDRSDARMTVTAQTSGNDSAGMSTPGTAIGDNLAFGYAENNDANRSIALDNVDDMIQLILPLAGLKPPTGSGYIQLSRSTPMLWPYCGEQFITDTAYYNYQLWAHSCQPIPSGSADAAPILSDGIATAAPVLVPYIFTDNLRGFAPAYLRYKFYAFNVDFSAVDYPILPDTALTPIVITNAAGQNFDIIGGNRTIWPEWTRNVRIRPNPFVDILQLEGGQLQFVEDPVPNPPVPPLGIGPAGQPVIYTGQAFPAPFKLTEKKGMLTVEWFNVPADFVLSAKGKPDEGQPTMFNRALGCVNATTFLGCPPETLLFREQPEFISKPYGARRRDLIKQYVYPWQYDIKMRFAYFNPPTGVVNAPSHQGHNVFAPKGQLYYLFANRPAGNLAPNNPANVNANNPPVFLPFDFRFLFSHANTF